MIDYLLQHIQHIWYWAYPALFIAMAFEWDLVLLTTGFFIRMWVLDPLWTTLALLGGTLFWDYGWYLVGRHSRHFRWKWLEKLYVATKFAEKHIIWKLAHTLCIAKFVYGLHRPICFRCGSLHVPRKIFIEANTAASIVWILVVAGIGYLAGASFMAARHYLKFAEIGIIVIILLIVGIMHFVSKKFKKDDLLK
jgi:membrane protein DedA with SNARE-associated domain